MCRLVGWTADAPVTAREALGDEAVDRLLQLSEVHCHGWGAALRTGDRLDVRRSPAPAYGDPAFRAVLDTPATAAVLHIRMGTPGYGRSVAENHPFTDGTYAFAHNGAVLPADAVDGLLSPSSRRRPTGTTDSERIFLALRDELGDAPADAAGIAAALAVVVERALGAGLHASSWNSMLLGPHGLSVICYHDRSWVPGDIKVWPEVYPPQAVAWPPYFDLRLRVADGIRVVTSSGIVDDVSGSELLANHTVLQLGPGGEQRVGVPPAGALLSD